MKHTYRSRSGSHRRSTALLFVALLSGACASGRRGGADDARPVPIAAEAAVSGDPRIEGGLALLDPRIVDSAGGRTLAFELRNTTDRAQTFLYAIEWFDRGGRPVDAARRAWLPLTIEPASARAIEVRVPVPEAESWRWHAIDPESIR